jgi:hypothetical protein
MTHWYKYSTEKLERKKYSSIILKLFIVPKESKRGPLFFWLYIYLPKKSVDVKMHIVPDFLD